MTPTPNSDLYLLHNVELDPDYNFTIDFDNKQSQEAYFHDKIANVLDFNEDYSYIRDNQSLKVYANIEDLDGVNYLMYKNNDRWFYAFITHKEYVSDKVSRINFKIDAFQTFLFDFELQESFIDREHQDRYNKDGNPIYNRMTENLEKGTTFIQTNKIKVRDNIPENFTLASGTSADKSFQLFWVYIVAKESIGKGYWSTAGGLITGTQPTESQTTNVKGMPTNVFTYIAPLPLFMGTWANAPVVRCVSKENITSDTSIVSCLNLKTLLDISQDPNVISINIARYCPFSYNCDKDTERIVSTDGTLLYTATRYKLYPTKISGEWTSDIKLASYNFDASTKKGSGAMFYIQNPNNREAPVLSINHNTKIDISSLNIENLKSIDFETKLKTSDFHYFEVEFGNQRIKYNEDDFSTGNIELELLNAFSIKGSQAIIPLNYKGLAENYHEALTSDSTINELPLRTDAWLTYLSQHKASLISGFITKGAQTIAGIATGNMFSITNAINTAGDIANSMAQIHDIKNTPDEVKQTTLDVALDYCMKDLYINFNTFDIREEFRSKIFNYLFHYGYKCNDFKKPNIRSRYYFNYIKTLGANIKTNIDSDFKNEIANIFNNGITIWHYRNKSTFKGVNNFDYENVETNLLGG